MWIITGSTPWKDSALTATEALEQVPGVDVEPLTWWPSTPPAPVRPSC